jgi:GT2 family glycosyltransferase
MNKKISVIIPTQNGLATIIPCLKSIINQSVKPQEIIIVDNASTDRTIRKVQNLKVNSQGDNLKLKIIKNKKNLGVTGGRNRGIREVMEDVSYLFFFDHDMVAENKMLEELVKVAQKYPKVGVVTPKIYYWGDKKVIWSAGTGINLWSGQVIFRGGIDVGQYEKDQEVQVAPAAMLVKKEVISKIHKFDDIFFAVYEDTDFCFRAKNIGYLTYYAPKAIAYHKIPYKNSDVYKRLVERLYWIGRNRTIFMKRFGRSMIIYLLFSPMYFMYYSFLSIRYGKLSNISDYLRGFVDGLSSSISNTTEL